jgi:hypothetical protein
MILAYERHGYRAFGQIGGHPPGTSRIVMTTRFE